MRAEGDAAQHGKPRRWPRVTANGWSARTRPGRCGVADRPVVPRKPGNAGGGKGPEFKVSAGSGEGPTRRLATSLTTPPTVQKLRAALHAKAKGAPGYRFYALYDKVYRPDVLAHAYHCCKANRGAAGVDGQTFGDIEVYGLERWLEELTKELQDKTYRPQAVRRVHIPKPDGKQRPLGIPTVRDRVVQMAAVIVLEPIYEADLQPEQYAYRPGRRAHEAIRHVHQLLSRGQVEVVDADLSGYFDSIPHAELMTSVARRVSDGAMLHLVKMWLEQPVEEEDACGHKQRTTRHQDQGRGTPQGAPISPLLSNLYMRRFILGWKKRGHEKRLGAAIVNYADDFVICCRRGQAAEAMATMRQMMAQLKLTVNEAKTQIRRLPEETFDFLGYTFGRCWSVRTGKAYLGTRPAQQRIARLCQAISAMTDKTWTWLDPAELVGRIGRMLIGWANYFCLGPVSKAYRAVDRHTRNRLRQWLRRKHQLKGRVTKRFPDQYLHQTLGLVRLQERTAGFSWAKA
jgi:RNA-directed DNA polymerase